jgi:ribosomal protein L7/L12
MAKVTKEFIINALYTHPTSEREIGFNSAMITILKELISDTTTTPVSTEHSIFSAVFADKNGYLYSIDSTVVSEIISHINRKEKLQAVKLLKEKTGIGLREAKDVIDTYCDRTAF